jgi:GTP-binding protein
MNKLRTAARQVTFVGSFPEDPPVLGLPEVAFVGRSNVGKSSALNKLLGARAARTSRTPGRTQLVNLFKLGDLAVLADLPGYGFAKVSKQERDRWKSMIDRYLAMRADLRAVVVLVDGRHPPQDLDATMLDALSTYEILTVVVATKVDKLSRGERPKALAAIEQGFELPKGALVPFSSVTGEGVDELWDRLGDVLK